MKYHLESEVFSRGVFTCQSKALPLSWIDSPLKRHLCGAGAGHQSSLLWPWVAGQSPWVCWSRGSAPVSAPLSHPPGWDLPDRKFMTEVWDRVIGTALKPKEVGAFGRLALVPHQCSDCREGGCGGEGSNSWVAAFLRWYGLFFSPRGGEFIQLEREIKCNALKSVHASIVMKFPRSFHLLNQHTFIKCKVTVSQWKMTSHLVKTKISSPGLVVQLVRAL